MPNASLFTDDDKSILDEAFKLALPPGQNTLPVNTLITTLQGLIQRPHPDVIQYLNKSQFSGLLLIVQQATMGTTELTFPQLLKLVNDFLTMPGARQTSREQYKLIFDALSNGQPTITIDSLKLAAQSTYSDAIATEVIALLATAEADLNLDLEEFISIQQAE